LGQRRRLLALAAVRAAGHRLPRLDRLKPALDLGVGAQMHEFEVVMGRDALRHLAPMTAMVPQHPPRDPVAAEHVTYLLAVPVPQLLPRDRASDRPAQAA